MDPSLTAAPIYLDHAATGWPKEEAVYRAVETQMRSIGVAAGRGTYRRATLSGQVLAQCRSAAARCFGSPSDGHWLLTTSGTHSLNLAIHGLLGDNEHVVTTDAEHNSVLRPLTWSAQLRGTRLECVPCDAQGRVRADQLLTAVRPETRMVVVTHGSNVTGAVQPIEQISDGLIAGSSRELSPWLIIDAAQTAGLMPVDLNASPVDLMAMPGHKGLGGPLGTGLLYVSARAAARLVPWLQGGTGVRSDEVDAPTTLPESLEPGNANVPALAGLAEALRQLESVDLAARAERLSRRSLAIADQLRTIAGLRVHSAGQLPIVAVTSEVVPASELAAILDAEFGIETRSGLHCAPRIHSHLEGSPAESLRISFADSTPDQHLQQVVDALREITAAF